MEIKIIRKTPIYFNILTPLAYDIGVYACMDI